jgi:multiple sugar transport system substrate-binding protein
MTSARTPRGKQWLRSTLGIFLVATTVTGGALQVQAQGRAERAPQAPVTLQVWHTYNAAETAQFVREAKAFQQANPDIKLNLYSIPYNQRGTKVPTAVQTNTLPDILRADYPYQFYLAALNKSLPLDVYMKGWDGLKDIPSWLIKGATYHGHIVTIPMQPWPRALFYNKTLFKKAGIAHPPATWAEFISDAKKLTHNGVVGFDLIGDQQNGNFMFLMVNAMMGGSIFKDNNNPTPTNVNLTSPQSQKALALYAQMLTNHVVESGLVSNSFNDMIQNFQSGKAAMTIDGSWEIGTYAGVKGLDFGVAPLPVLPGAPYKTYGDYSLYVIPSTTKYPKQAVKTLEWLLSKPEVAQWSTSLGEIPALRQSVESGSQVQDYLGAHPSFKAFAYAPSDYAPFFAVEPPVPYANDIFNAISTVLQEWYLNKITQAQVLPQMQQQAQAIVKKNM